jgi:RHS repeat-associated protein
MRTNGIQPALPMFEKFIADYPNSPWAPSLRANLGRYYREHGLYTRALEHWQAAWDATHTATNGPAKGVADFTFAYWTSLLASLGRMDTLKGLFEETRGRVFDGGPYQQIINETREGFRTMRTQPGICFKCGTYALGNVGRVLKGPKFNSKEIDETPSPTCGFSMTKLLELSQEAGLDLVPVEWSGDKELVVPSVVHWKEDHYVAIVESRPGAYHVLDPTFGRPRWLSAQQIEEEASGQFLIPKSKVPGQWKILQTAQTDKIFGRGYATGINDNNDGCGNGSGGCCTGSGDCSTCNGMAIWEVSEPYISTWLYDEPLGYQPALGGRISFNLAYKQRETSVNTNSLFNLGNHWDFSWFSYILDDTNDSEGIMTVPGGGQRIYQANTTNQEYFSHTTLERLTNSSGNLTGFIVSHFTGAKDYYGFVPSTVMIMGDNIALLTAMADPFGHTNSFVYEETNNTVLLRYVIDTDNRTNTVSYGNSSFPLQITSVQDPFGRTATLSYSSTGMLTNVTDVAGLNSSFKYDSQNWVTNLITPYGLTTFDYTTNNDGISGDNEFQSQLTDPNSTEGQYFNIRTARVVDPAGATNVYVLRQNANMVYDPATGSNDVFYLDWQVADNLWPTNLPNGTFDNDNMYFRNSFHWGPLQALNLPQDLSKLTVTNYLCARRRHWFHDRSGVSIGQTLELEQYPSPDGVIPGQLTWFDYADTVGTSQGTNSLPLIIARVLPDGSIWFRYFQRDDWGRPTNVVDTYSPEYGLQPQTRTNLYIYDPSNDIDLIQVIGPRGETLVGYAYDSNHDVIRMTSAVGEVTAYTIDTAGRLTSIRTPAGLTTTNIYFASGTNINYVEQTIDKEINRTNTYSYANDLVYIHTNELGLIKTNLYDNLQRLTNSADSRGAISYLYSTLDLVKITDRMGFTNTFGYDANRRMTNATDARGNSTLYSYCTCGSLDSIEDATGTNLTQFFYNNAGWLTNTTYADGTIITANFDLMGRVTNTVDSAGHSITNWFNNQGLKYAVSNAFGQVMAIGLDIEDRAATNTDANDVTVTSTFDNLRRPLTRTYPDTGTEQFFYGPAGLVAYTNQLNEVTLYNYDAARRKTVETNANLQVIQYSYDAASDLLTLTDGKSQETSWAYDAYGRVTTKTDAAGTNILAYEYDSNNRLTNRWSITMGNTRYGYDAAGNLLTILYPVSDRPTPSVTNSYDALNRLTNMVDGVGVTRYTYTAVGQILSEDGPWNNDTVTFGYTAMQRTSLSLQQPTGSWTNGFAYDAAKRLTNVASPAGTFSYAYDALRSTLPSAVTLPNTSYITNVYDGNARMLATTLYNSAGATLDAAEYGYNVGNQRTALTNAAGTDVAYTYDAIGQLTVATSSVSAENRGYSYDAAWNLNHLTNNGVNTTFSVNDLNELTNEASTSLSYDGNGNLTLRAPSAGLGVTNYYDAENRLADVETTSNAPPDQIPIRTTFVYDGLGRLREQLWWTNSAVPPPPAGGGVPPPLRNTWVVVGGIDYVYDGNRVIQERDFYTNPLVSYTRGNDLSGTFEGAGGIGGLLARSDVYSSGNFSRHIYYHADGNGNITYLVNSAQTLAASYRYDPFGNLTASSGGFAALNTYRFSSKEFIPSVGLYCYLYRFYDPSLQRWMNRDPIGELGGLNLYRYGANSPINAIDPFGWCNSHSWVYNLGHAIGNLLMGNPGPGNPDSYAVLRTEELGSANFDFSDLVGDTAQAIYDTANAVVVVAAMFEGPAAGFGDVPVGEIGFGALSGDSQAGLVNLIEGASGDIAGDAEGLATWEGEGGNLGATAAEETGPVQAGELTTYQDFVDRSVVGDNLAGHELWQHANLNENGLATTRLSTPASQMNPVIALDQETHAAVNAAQRALDARAMTPAQNINANAQILRNLNAAPPGIINAGERAALNHAASYGY